VHTAAFCVVALVAASATSPALAQFAGAATVADGSSCTAGWFAWPDPSGRALICVGGVYQAVSTSSQWINSGSNIFYNGGNVGIGTTGPLWPLEVVSSSTTWAVGFQNTNSSSPAQAYFAQGAGYGGYIDAGSNASSSTYVLDVNKAGSPYLYVRGDGNVGIGTTAPQHLLTVVDTANADNLWVESNNNNTSLTLNDTASGGREWRIVSGATASIAPASFAIQDVTASNAIRLSINSSGNVGIGTTGPNNKLDIQGGNLSVNSGTTNNSSPSILELGGDTTNFDVFEATSSTLLTINKGGWANVEIVGNVGIGTATPTSPSGFPGIAELYNSSSAAFVANGNGSATEFASSPNGGWVAAGAGLPLRLGANGGEQMRITSAGSVGIGTSAPNATLEIHVGTGMDIGFNGSSSYSHIFSYNDAWSGYQQFDIDGAPLVLNANSGGYVAIDGVIYNPAMPNSPENWPVCFNTSNGQLGYYGACGSSSRRFKHDIQSLGAAQSLDEVLHLRPVSFVYNNDQDPLDQKAHIGFIAEEVNEIDQRLVTFEKDGVTPHGLYYENFTAILAGAVQEIKATLDGDHDTIAGLKSDNDELKAANDNETALIRALTARLDALEAERR
jgi:hypothetical protein